MNSSTLPLPHHRISPQDVENYHREGYHIFRKPVFPEAKFLGLKNCFENENKNQTAITDRPTNIPTYEGYISHAARCVRTSQFRATTCHVHATKRLGL